MKKIVYSCRYIIFFVLIVILISINNHSFSSKPTANPKWSVYSIEVLFNNKSLFDFQAQTGEEFDISITVNNYKESYKFSRFFAWIDYNDELIELKYGNNSISLDEAGHYEVKVSIIDGVRRLMTKSMPFEIIKPIDNQPPKIIGEINNINELLVFSNIGLVLPNFEIIDNIDTNLKVDIECEIGEIRYDDIFEIGYYINNTNQNDKLSIKAQDSSNNETELQINIINKPIQEKLYNWIIPLDIIFDYQNIFLSPKAIFYKGKEKTIITYDNFNIDQNIILNFKQYQDNSNLKLKFNYDLLDYYIVELDFNQNKMKINDKEISMLQDLSELIISFDAQSIIFSYPNGLIYDFNLNHIKNITSISLEMTDLCFSAEIR